MGNLFLKPKQNSGSGSVQDLQERILRYIFNDHDDNRDPVEVIKGYQKFGFISIEHFLQDIPYDVWKLHEIGNGLFFTGVGSRFVLENDYGTRGKCTSIKLEMAAPDNHNAPQIFIDMKLDQPKHGSVEPPILMRYPIHQLLLEKHHLQNILKQNEPKLEIRTTVPDSSKNLKLNDFASSVFDNVNHSPKLSLHSGKRNSDSFTEPEGNMQTSTFHSNDPNIIPQPPKLYSVPSTSIPASQTNKRLESKKQPRIPRTNETPKIISLTGDKRGIHGSNNSCYMDSLLFSLFYTTHDFDKAFLARKDVDSNDALELKRILSENVAKPLRKEFYCPPSNLMGLRSFLSKFDDRFQGAMMDIEELVYQMLEDILQEPHFLQYNNKTQDYIHQILTTELQESEDPGKITDLQSCLEDSFKLWGDLHLLQCPNPAFLIQLPRSDGDLMHYKGILPNKYLDLRKILTQKECCLCHVVKAEWECDTCRNNSLPNMATFCKQCIKANPQKVWGHEHVEGSGHVPQLLYNTFTLELHSIICINSAHYTAFVKCFEAHGHNNWFYFDSMSGPFPEVTLLSNFGNKLRQAEMSIKRETLSFDKWVNKAMTDCHICIYLPTTRSHEKVKL